uniref:Uncharacterized protein n=1 Tax=Oryza sativa subsp. japonica TaxID=39947 RepID=Q6Z5U2_ORYSJ|nr:hypothetical protein [Oryza sativa Japonica Group]
MHTGTRDEKVPPKRCLLENLHGLSFLCNAMSTVNTDTNTRTSTGEDTIVPVSIFMFIIMPIICEYT